MVTETRSVDVQYIFSVFDVAQLRRGALRDEDIKTVPKTLRSERGSILPKCSFTRIDFLNTLASVSTNMYNTTPVPIATFVMRVLLHFFCRRAFAWSSVS